MEKMQFNNIPKSIEEPQKEVQKSSSLSRLIKAAAITIGMAATHSSFAQDSEKGQDKNKIEYKTEVLQDISTYYHKLAKFKETTLNYLDYKTTPIEVIARVGKEIKDEISKCKEIEKNPEKFYAEAKESTEQARSKLISYYSSKEFLDRLNLHMTDEEAKAKQESLVKNLKDVDISFVSPDTIQKHSSGAGAIYIIKDHKILVPYENVDGDYLTHELIHSAYRADKQIDEKELDILWKQYKHNKEANNEYQRSPAERIVRVEKAIMELNSKIINDARYFGILKEGEKFGKQHYDKLMEMKKENMIGLDMQDLLNTTNEKQFIKLMNEIADASNPKETKEINFT